MLISSGRASCEVRTALPASVIESMSGNTSKWMCGHLPE